ncbi:unannotated protein [freshwater metagenome]|uniref:Unannotated protein n=1 Tax=freshwater metagenome TaxID=449393 RepID=A0A6J7GM58_9ZZZZ
MSIGVVCGVGMIKICRPTCCRFHFVHATTLLGGAPYFRVVASLFILLPPSEGKAEGGAANKPWRESSGACGKSLTTQRETLVDRLHSLKGGDATLLGVKGKHLDRARVANTSLHGSPSLPAFERYTGVVWDHLDIATLTAAQRNRALSSIIVISGLLGAVGADEPVPDYRLKIGARLAPFGLLSRWWHDDLSAMLNKKFKGAVVVDLLPQEHRAAFTLDTDIVAKHIVVAINEKSGKAGGHDAKAAKGRLARHLVQTCTSASQATKSLQSFRDPRFVVTTDLA